MKTAIQIVKYWPIITTLVLIISLLLCLFEIQYYRLLPILFGHSLFIDFIFLYFSFKFRFCLWHRVFIYNLMTGLIFKWLDSQFIDLNQVTFVRLFLLINGVTLIISSMLYFRFGCFKVKKL